MCRRLAKSRHLLLPMQHWSMGPLHRSLVCQDMDMGTLLRRLRPQLEAQLNQVGKLACSAE